MDTPVDSGFEISPAQKRLWRLRQHGCTLQNEVRVLIRGELDEDQLASAVHKVISRHEILRTTCLEVPNLQFPIQIVHDYYEPQPEQPASGPDREETMHTAADQGVDSLRLKLIRLEEQEHVLTISLPALLSDTCTLINIIDEIVTGYLIGWDDREAPLQFVQFSEWHNEIIREEGEAGDYWRSRNEAPVKNMLPFEMDGTPGLTLAPRVVEVPLETALHDRVLAFTGRHDLELPVFLLSCLKVMLWKYLDGRAEVVVGNITDGRTYDAFKSINGPLAVTLPIRVTLRGDDTIAEVCQRVREETAAARNGQDAFTWGAAEDAATLAQMPYCPVCFEYSEMLAASFSGNGVTYTIDKIYSRNDFFKLKLHCYSEQDHLRLELYYHPGFFRDSDAELIKNQFVGLLENVLAQPDAPVSTLVRPAAAEQYAAAACFSRNKTPGGESKTAIELFEERVALSPDRPAVVFGNDLLSYRELNEQANRVARGLAGPCRVQPGDVVAVLLPRSDKAIAALLGVLKTGATYLPLDTGTPPNRLQFMLTDSNARVLITGTDVAARHGLSTPQLLVEAGWDEPVGAASENPQPARRPGAAVYTIYTSGSTGVPKGVCIPNSALVNYLAWFQDTYHVNESDRTLLFSSLAYDLAYTSVWSSLVGGAALHILPESKHLDPDALTGSLAGNGITFIKLTPSHFSLIVNDPRFGQHVRAHALRLVVIGGEAIKCNDLEKYFAHRSDVTFVNHYGPTETTIGTLTQTITPANFGVFRAKPVIGKAVINNQVCILNDSNELLPAGLTGEICIAGKGLALGYLNRPELTHEKFICHPLLGEKLYKTGDLGRWMTDGTVEFLGRKDNQVKIRGYRVELGEVEATLKNHPRVKEAVAAVRTDKAGDRDLVAFVQFRGEAVVEPLRPYLAAYLPEPSLPTEVIRVEHFPLTANGKIDRNALWQVVRQPAGMGAYAAPRNSVEAQLAAIWQEVLGREKIGIHDDFFTIGGHSLKAVQIISRTLLELNVKLELRSVFSHPTVAGLAAVIAGQEAVGYQQIEPVAEQPDYDLSAAQKRLWIMQQVTPGQVAYNMSSGYTLEGTLRQDAFTEAFEMLIRRHESLRTRFVRVNDEPRQQIVAYGATGFRVQYADLRGEAGRQEKAERLVYAEARKPFSLEEGPLVRALLVQLEEERYYFAFTMHHIVSDGWSMEVLINEVITLYNAYAEGKENPLPPLRVQYKDYAAWHNRQLEGARLVRHQQYWLRQLGGKIVPLLLPTDFARPAVKTYNGDSVKFLLPQAEAAALTQLGQRHGASLFMGLVAAVKALLHRYTLQEDIVVGLPIAGRNCKELENQIGLYLNNLCLRTRVTGEDTFEQLLLNVKNTTLNAYEHDVYPFDRLVEDLRIQRDISRSPLFDVVVVLRNVGLNQDTDALGDLHVTPSDTGFRTSTIDLRLAFTDTGRGIRGLIDYNADLFMRETIVLLHENLDRLIGQVTADPAMKLFDIQLGEGIGSTTGPCMTTQFNF